MTGIDGKVVAITGASSGIGRAAALLLAGRGAKVVLGARRTDELEALVREIEGAGGDAIYNGTNVAKREDVAALTALACDRYGKLDVFISNAGIGPISRLEDLRVEDSGKILQSDIKLSRRATSRSSDAPCRCRRTESVGPDRSLWGTKKSIMEGTFIG